MADQRAQALSVLRQLVDKAAPYVSGHEANIFSSLVRLRGLYPTQSLVSTNIDEVAEELLPIADPSTSITAIVNILNHDDQHDLLKQQSWCLAMTTIAQLLRSPNMPTFHDSDWTDLGAIAQRALEDDDPEVRRSCMAMCVEMQKHIGDQDKLFNQYLPGLNDGHRNLLTYYIARGL